jgi:nicotinate phosphoribosyltransferase
MWYKREAQKNELEVSMHSPQEYCRQVNIVATGGLNPEKIRRFEKLGVPVDIFGVGSSLFAKYDRIVTDFTADAVRVKVHGDWIPMAKVGHQACDNPELERIVN